ncbi:MAG: isopentenyl-diphosphate Delta-isomerase [Sphingobacteriales bacterium]|nr:MAG: isopentenyl-diphosphate Delta-isomerase [Sphingobacteriales bacterium]
MEQVILVDTHNNELGTLEKMEAHRQGLLHRAFSVFIVNDAGEMLLQKRALHKYHSGGLWTNACCSHPRPNEETLSAAHRRLREEMGIADCELTEAFSFIYFAELDDDLKENEFDHVFIGKWNGIPVVNTDEVADYKWISPSTLLADVEVNPKAYTFWFKEVLARVLDEVSGTFF